MWVRAPEVLKPSELMSNIYRFVELVIISGTMIENELQPSVVFTRAYSGFSQSDLSDATTQAVF